MIISFDGNTYLGKTSVIKSLKECYPNSEICEEYDTDPDLLVGRTHLENQTYYFGLEAERQVKDREEKIVLLDRSYLSVLAHSYAVSLMEKKNLLAETVGLLEKQKEKGLVIRQQAAVIFLQPKGNRIYSDVDQKGGEDILYDEQYRRNIDLFYREILRILKKRGGSDANSLERIYVWEGKEKDNLIDWLEECKKDQNEKEDLLFEVLYTAVKELSFEIGY